MALLELYFRRETRDQNHRERLEHAPAKRPAAAVAAAADVGDVGGAVEGVDCSRRQKLASAAAGKQYKKPVFHAANQTQPSQASTSHGVRSAGLELDGMT